MDASTLIAATAVFVSVATFDGHRMPEWPDAETERYWQVPSSVGSIRRWGEEELFSA